MLGIAQTFVVEETFSKGKEYEQLFIGLCEVKDDDHWLFSE